MNHRDELYGLNGFGEMQLEPRMDRLHAIFDACIGSQGDSRNECTRARHRAYAAYERISIFARHTDVTDQHMRRVPTQYLQRFIR